MISGCTLIIQSLCFLSVSDKNGGNPALSDTMSWEEFIELRDLRSTKEQIELTGTRAPCSPPRLERTNALRISPGRVPDLLSRVGIIRVLSSSQDPQLTEEKGEGHDFQPCSHAQPTWCDLCGDFIWGLYKQSLRCVSELAYICSLCIWVCACVNALVHLHEMSVLTERGNLLTQRKRQPPAYLQAQITVIPA